MRRTILAGYLMVLLAGLPYMQNPVCLAIRAPAEEATVLVYLITMHKQVHRVTVLAVNLMSVMRIV